MIRTILAAVDESSSAAAVMEASLEMGKAFEAKVYLSERSTFPRTFRLPRPRRATTSGSTWSGKLNRSCSV